MRTKLNAQLATGLMLFASCLSWQPSAFAEDQPLPPPPPAPLGARNADEPPPAPKPLGNANAEEPPPAPKPLQGAAAPASGLATADEVGPGPLADKRKALLKKIQAAKEQGVGTSAYLNFFKGIEETAATNPDEAALGQRIDAVSKGLDEQIKRSAILKVQRPAPPVIPLDVAPVPHSGMRPGGGGGGLAAGGNDALMRQLQSKFGDKIPAGLGGIDPNQLKGFLNSDAGRDLLKKIQH